MKIRFGGSLTRGEFLQVLDLKEEPLKVDGLQVPWRLLSAPAIISAAGLAIASLAGVIIIGYQVATTGVTRLIEIVWMVSCLVSFGIIAAAFRIADAFLRQWKKRKSLREPLEGTISYDGIDLESPSGPQHLSWSELATYRRGRNLVVLVDRTGKPVPLPRRYFATEADWETFGITVDRELRGNGQAAEQKKPKWSAILVSLLIAVLVGLALLGVEAVRVAAPALASRHRDLWLQVTQTQIEVILAAGATSIGVLLAALLVAIPALLTSIWPALIGGQFVDGAKIDELAARSHQARHWVDQFSSMGFVTLGVRIERPLWAPRSREIAFTSKLAEAYGDITVRRFGMYSETARLYTPFADGAIVLTTTWKHIRPSDSATESVTVIPSTSLEQLLRVHTERVQAFKARGKAPDVGFTTESRLAAARQYHSSVVGRRSMRRYAFRAAAYAGFFVLLTAGVVAAGFALRGATPWYDFDR